MYIRPLAAPELMRSALVTLRTLLLGFLGGWLFTALHIPAGWVVGSMCVLGGTALLGGEVVIPAPLRTFVYILIGTSTGSSVTPETLGLMRQWPLSLLLASICTLLCMVVSSRFLSDLYRWDHATARYASTPGGLAQIMVMVTASSADIVRVVTVQSIRIAMVVLAMPWLTLLVTMDHSIHSAGAFRVMATMTGAQQILASICICGLGGFAYLRLKLPGSVLLGAMIASALLHGTGLVEGRLPSAMSIPAFVTVGAIMGSRFVGQSFISLSSLLAPAIGSSLISIGISACFAWIGSHWLHLPFEQLWAAYAPGGIEAMTVMGASLGLDTAFIGVHHLLRILGIGLILPAWTGGTRVGSKRNDEYHNVDQ